MSSWFFFWLSIFNIENKLEIYLINMNAVVISFCFFSSHLFHSKNISIICICYVYPLSKYIRQQQYFILLCLYFANTF